MIYSKYLFIGLILFNVHSVYAQSRITGTVKDEQGVPVGYATIQIKEASEGTTTDSLGNFSLVSYQNGQKNLVVSMVGYEDYNQQVLLNGKDINLSIVLKQAGTKLEEVVISAGTFKADNSTVAILNSNDIVTTAGAQGDIVGAIQTLPGVQRNGGDETGLLVHGGDATETMVIIDGVVAQNAFLSPVPGVSQRSRFSPFQFKGTSFNSGGYSVRYGQALSSILELETNDLPNKSTLNAGVSFSGIAVSGAQLMDNNAIEFSGNYLNLKPFYGIAKTNVDYFHPPTGGGFGARWLSKVGDKGLFKMNFQQGFIHTGVVIPDPDDYASTINFDLKNENTFYNISYRHFLSDKTKLFTALSYSSNTDNIIWEQYPAYKNDNRLQGRVELSSRLSSSVNLLTGVDIQRYTYVKNDSLYNKFTEDLYAGFIESEWKPFYWMGFKGGVRAEYSSLLEQATIAPRISAAVKLTSNSQVSFASGIFYQSVNPVYLLAGYKPGFQKAIHYILNYQYQKQGRTFRLEGYLKDYDDLIREKGIAYNPNPYRTQFGITDNSGYGYAKGADIFWRDKKSIKNFDYWISYSYVDTRRLYQNYPAEATPNYVSPHNLNIIAKYFIDKLQTNISASYGYASGRGYYNPASAIFLSDKSPNYQNLAMTFSYLHTFKNLFSVVYVSIDNITNRKNILGYRYSNTGNLKYPILPPVYRSVFIGVNLSLTKFEKDEL